MVQLPQPAFILKFAGTIWRVVTDPTGSMVVAEILEKDAQRKSFAAIDTTDGRLLWQQWAFEEYPLLNAVALHRRTLYLQALSTGQPPQAEALLAVDVSCRAIKWKRPRVSWAGIAAEGVVVLETGYERLRHLLLHPQDGTVIREISSAEIGLAEGSETDWGGYPVHYPEGSPYTHSIAQFISDKLGVMPASTFDYVQKKEAIVISYYLYQASQYENFIAVFDRGGHLLWQQKIAGALPGTGVNTFLTTDDLLIFVKEKNQLLGYVL